MTDTAPNGPLAGLRVLDISTVVAGPFASTLLADLGAEVLKVEMPGSGDALRRLAPHKDGIPLWWKVTNRNKRGITLDLRKPEGKALLGRLIESYDVLVENFRTGTLDDWGITRDWLQATNPRLVILRVTGFGQTGPYRNNPGFARVFEAMSGLTRMCGEEGGTPLHLGYPISDAIGGLFGAIGILAELHRLKDDKTARGQEIDCAVTEAMMRTLDFLAIEYDQLGSVRTQTGNRSQYAAPGNIYGTSDGKWASIAASTQSIFERFCKALGMPHLITDPRFIDNPSRVKNWQAIDRIVADAISKLTLDELRTCTSTRSAFRRSMTPPTSLPIRISLRASRSSASPMRSLAPSGCNAWSRASPRPRSQCVGPGQRSASTMMKFLPRSGYRRRILRG